MPELKRARLEGTKCPMAAFLIKALLNYVQTVEEYVFAFSKGTMQKNCERTRKIVKELEKLSETMQVISFFIQALS